MSYLSCISKLTKGFNPSSTEQQELQLVILGKATLIDRVDELVASAMAELAADPAAPFTHCCILARPTFSRVRFLRRFPIISICLLYVEQEIGIAQFQKG